MKWVNSFSRKNRISMVSMHCHFIVSLSFAVVGSVAATALKITFVYFLLLFILVQIWRNCLLKYGSTVIKSFLEIILIKTFEDTALSQNYFLHSLTKSNLPSKRIDETQQTLRASIKIGFWKYFQIFVISEEHVFEVVLHGVF